MGAAGGAAAHGPREAAAPGLRTWEGGEGGAGAWNLPRPRRSEEGLEAHARSSEAPCAERDAPGALAVRGARFPSVRAPRQAAPQPSGLGWARGGVFLPFLSLKLSVLQPAPGLRNWRKQEPEVPAGLRAGRGRGGGWARGHGQSERMLHSVCGVTLGWPRTTLNLRGGGAWGGGVGLMGDRVAGNQPWASRGCAPRAPGGAGSFHSQRPVALDRHSPPGLSISVWEMGVWDVGCLKPLPAPHLLSRRPLPASSTGGQPASLVASFCGPALGTL